MTHEQWRTVVDDCNTLLGPLFHGTEEHFEEATQLFERISGDFGIPTKSDLREFIDLASKQGFFEVVNTLERALDDYDES
jgi:hypothetical protein